MLSILTFATFALQFFLVSSSPAKRSGCTVQDPASLMKLPAGFPAPSSSLSYVAVAIGTQNYTCSSAGTYTNVGAVAELFDISCLATSKTVFDKIADAAIGLWKIAPPNLTPQKVVGMLSNFKNPIILGQHYYVTNPITRTGVNPEWDFTSAGVTAGNPNAYVVAARNYGSAAPSGSTDIDWVYLTNIGAGELADGVYRTDTKLGQPPASCTPGSAPITVKYAAKYWLYGGSMKH